MSEHKMPLREFADRVPAHRLARAAIAAMPKPEWRDIDDAPEDGKEVFVVTGDGRVFTTPADGGWWRLRRSEGAKQTPRYWMPITLPEPPK